MSLKKQCVSFQLRGAQPLCSRTGIFWWSQPIRIKKVFVIKIVKIGPKTHLLVEFSNSDQNGVCDQNCQNSTKNQNHPIWVEIRIWSKLSNLDQEIILGK